MRSAVAERERGLNRPKKMMFGRTLIKLYNGQATECGVERQLTEMQLPYISNLECRKLADRLRPPTSALWSSSSKNLHFTE